MGQLTKRSIEAAKYEGDGNAQDVRYDGEIPGFGLRIYPSGVKSFVLRYRNEGGRTRLITLGRFGPLTLDQARKKARKELAKLYDGADPLEERRRARAEATTVSEFCDRWLTDYAKPHRKSWPEDERRIEKRIKPAIGSRPLSQVTPGDVAQLHARIGRKAPVEANRVVQLLRGIYNAALAWEVVPRGHPNPAQISRSPYGGRGAAVRTFRERSRERFVREDEMPRLVKAIEKEEDPAGRAALLLILWTGCRKSEILGARWDHINLKRRELVLPEAKEGGRTVLLSDTAVDVLKRIKRTRSPYVFPSPRSRGKPRADIKRQWDRVREAAKLGDVTIHDLRRTVGAWLANAGVSELAIGKALGHSDPAATRVYARITDDTARGHLDDFAARVRRTRVKAVR